MKTIAIDLTSLDDNFSGIEHYALFITKELIKSADFFFILFFKNKVSYFSEEELGRSNVKTKVIQGDRIEVLLFTLPKLIDELKPDYALFLSFPPSLLWKPKNGTKVISTIHDLVAFDVPRTMTWKSRLYFRKSIKHSLKISEKVVTISQFSANRIVNRFHYDSNNIILAYCSSAMLNVIKPCSDIQKKYNLPDNYVLTLSTVEPRKNISFLLKCMDYLWNHEEGIPKLVIAGRKGWKTDKLLEGLSQKAKDNIVFTGFVDDDDIASIYYYSNFFIFPSIYEGFGIPVLESLQVGKLSLCSNIPTNKEILGDDYPYLFDPKIKESFLKSFYKILNHRFDKQNFFDILNKFNWHDSGLRILSQLKNERNT